MQYKRFEDLPIWKTSLEITRLIYDLSAQAEWKKDYGLRDQIRRAIISVSSNIVEGYEKNNNNELIRYLRIAKGSVGEVRNQLYIALTVGYLDGGTFNQANEALVKLASEVGGFIGYLEEYRRNQKFVIRNS